jgi:phospholipase/lecithinase/hemolysin
MSCRPERRCCKRPSQAHIAAIKWGEYFDNVISNPARYELVKKMSLRAGRAVFGKDPTPCAAPGSHFYFHDGHPSTAVHRFVAHEMEGEFIEAFR